MTRAVLLWMIPLNLVLVAWVWLGRMLFGMGGLMVLVYLLTLVPVLLVGLLVTTVLSLTQPGRPRDLTRSQARAQLAVWGGMLVFGAVSIEYGDTLGASEEGDVSLLIRLLGDNDLGWAATFVGMGLAALVTVGAWVSLLVTLTAGRRAATTRVPA
ncbi:hypothetical protein QWY28_17955 [Nocardioides sp. SOB77]|uniref:DUF4175 domain-containing protein n=1 Tax=Nocardioides oceani TaxID=3058369 RepID=A0ABT8FL33_9ACTN|nr:hypothetical protein [Nocardioides oceani]MDN4174852.1 hypothetical protein [Nocardioides oceani]